MFQFRELTTADKKRFRANAQRNRKSLMKEHDVYGCYSDGGGKRYIVLVYHYLAGDIDKAADYFNWYAKEFPDDCGDAFFHLCSALTAYRLNDLTEAHFRLQNAMLENLYLVPALLGCQTGPLYPDDFNNWDKMDYLTSIETLLEVVPESDREWLKQAYQHPTIRRIHDHYITYSKELALIHSVEERAQRISQWEHYLQSEGFPAPK